MDLLIATLVLRPYVFAFVALFLIAGAVDLGWRRTLLFAAWVWPVAWVSEFSSTRTGRQIPPGFQSGSRPSQWENTPVTMRLAWRSPSGGQATSTARRWSPPPASARARAASVISKVWAAK